MLSTKITKAQSFKKMYIHLWIKIKTNTIHISVDNWVSKTNAILLNIVKQIGISLQSILIHSIY